MKHPVTHKFLKLSSLVFFCIAALVLVFWLYIAIFGIQIEGSESPGLERAAARLGRFITVATAFLYAGALSVLGLILRSLSILIGEI